MTPEGQGRPPGEFSDETGNDVRTYQVYSGVPLQPMTLSAFERYVIPEIQVLFRVARSLTRNDADAEDLVQDTLIRPHRSVDAFDGNHPRAWLLTILRNTHINRNRRRRPDCCETRNRTWVADCWQRPANGPTTSSTRPLTLQLLIRWLPWMNRSGGWRALDRPVDSALTGYAWQASQDSD